MTEKAITFAEEAVASWNGKPQFLSVLKYVEAFLAEKDIPTTRLGSWALLVVNGDSQTMANSGKLREVGKMQLSKQLLKGMEKKRLSVLAVVQDGKPTTMYRPGRAIITMLGTSTNTHGWTCGTRVVHMDKNGAILCMEDVAA